MIGLESMLFPAEAYLFLWHVKGSGQKSKPFAVLLVRHGQITECMDNYIWNILILGSVVQIHLACQLQKLITVWWPLRANLKLVRVSMRGWRGFRSRENSGHLTRLQGAALLGTTCLRSGAFQAAALSMCHIFKCILDHPLMFYLSHQNN